MKKEAGIVRPLREPATASGKPGRLHRPIENQSSLHRCRLFPARDPGEVVASVQDESVLVTAPLAGSEEFPAQTEQVRSGFDQANHTLPIRCSRRHERHRTTIEVVNPSV